jgi:hypothetical protein
MIDVRLFGILVRLVVSLIEYRGPSRNTNDGLTPADCKALGFMGPVEGYDTGYCQCRNESFRNEDGNGCCKCNYSNVI